MKTLRHSLIYSLLGFALAGMVSSVQAGTEKSLQDLFATRDYSAALVLIDEALEKDKDNFKLALARGFTLVQLRQLDEAIVHYKALMTAFPGSPKPRNNLAMVYRLQGKFNEAIEIFKQTIEAFPSYPRAYENLGDTYIWVALYQYQRGYQETGDTMFANKIELSQNFQQLAKLPTPAPGLLGGAPDKQIKLATPTFDAPVKAKLSASVKKTSDVDPQTAEAGREVQVSLLAWANDWMSGDAERYFSHYVSQFVPGKDQTLKEWKARKVRILAASEYITVRLSDVNIKFDPGNDEKAYVQFTQQYQSSTYESTSTKKLLMRKHGDMWLIVEETSK